AALVLPPDTERTVLRTATEIPFDPRETVSPLSGFRANWQGPVADSVLLRVDGLPDGALLPIATLDTYDGVVFSVGSPAVSTESGTFRRVPSAIDRSGAIGERVRIAVTVQGYSGIWVPLTGQLERIRF